MAKTATCLHKSDVKVLREGETSTCRLCGQQILITTDGKEKVLQRGYIDGAITDIHPLVNQASAELGESEVSLSSEVPPKPEGRKQLEVYCENNKDAILADYRSMRLRDFFKRWHLSSTSWTRLKPKWNVKGKHGNRSKKATRHMETVKVPVNVEDSLPPLPAFSNSWPEAVQIEWLRTYTKLRLSQKK